MATSKSSLLVFLICLKQVDRLCLDQLVYVRTSIGTWGMDPTKDFLIYRLEGFKTTNALFSKAKEWPGWGREGGSRKEGGEIELENLCCQLNF